ncbi:MAG TPA: hypothetical protein VME67_27280 [Mycobacterium sp.]|nr:hypothetical protein [Mycobacterium sp.]
MIGDLTLRWVVSILFGVSMAEYLYMVAGQANPMERHCQPSAASDDAGGDDLDGLARRDGPPHIRADDLFPRGGRLVFVGRRSGLG